MGHTPPYRHIYAQWLAPASGGTLDIEHWLLWVSSVVTIINSIKPYNVDAYMSLFTNTLSKDVLPAVFVGDFNWCLSEPALLPAAAAITAGFSSCQPLASKQA